VTASDGALVVRVAELGDDLTRAGRIVHDAYLDLPGYPVDPSYDDSLRDAQSRIAHGQIVIALLEGLVVGCLTFLPEHTSELTDFREPGFASIRMFGVDRAVQGLGVGRRMMQWCIDEARRLGCTAIGLHTLDVMPAAARLYTSLGFERTPSLDADYDGIPGRAYVLRL